MKSFNRNLILGLVSSTAIITIIISIAFIIDSSLKLKRLRSEKDFKSSLGNNVTRQVMDTTSESQLERESDSKAVVPRSTMVEINQAIRNTRINSTFLSTNIVPVTWLPDEYMKNFFNTMWTSTNINDWVTRGVITSGGGGKLERDGNVVRGTMEDIVNKSVTITDNIVSLPSIVLFKPTLFSMMKNRTKPLGPRSFKAALRSSILMRTQYGLQKRVLTTSAPDQQFWKYDIVNQWYSTTNPTYLYCSTAGGYIYGNFPPCRTIILVFKGVPDDSGSDFEVTVDGNLVLTSTTKNQPINITTGVNGVPIVFLLKDLPLQAHVVRITKKDVGSINGTSGQLIFYWGACATLTDFPELILLKENYLTAEGYKTLNFPIPANYLSTEYPPPTNADLDYWNGLMDEVVDELPIEMKNSTRIKVIDLNAAGFDTDIHLLDNGIMPNDIGSRFIGDQVLNYLSTLNIRNGPLILSKPADFQ